MPARLQASSATTASALVSAKGFSQYKCLPAAAIGFYLRAMLGVGCRKQHGLDRLVGQHLVERCSKRNLMLDREIANRDRVPA